MNKVKKIDIHLHSAPFRSELFRNPVLWNFPTPEELREIYDNMGIEKGVQMTLSSPEGLPRPITNEDSWELATTHPETYFWFCNIDPRQVNNTPDCDLTPLLEFYKGLGAKGVGEVTANLYFDDPYMYNLFSACEKCEMPLTFHVGVKNHGYGIVDDFGLPRLEKALQDFPNLKFLGHSQRFWSAISGDITVENWGRYPKGPVTPGGRIVELLRKYPNLYGDLSAGSGGNAMLRDPEHAYQFMEEFQDRLCFGLDIVNVNNIPNVKLCSFLDESMESGKISYEAYYKICRGNALKLLGIEE